MVDFVLHASSPAVVFYLKFQLAAVISVEPLRRMPLSDR